MAADSSNLERTLEIQQRRCFAPHLRALQKAQRDGKKRNPRRTHLVAHPEFPFTYRKWREVSCAYPPALSLVLSRYKPIVILNGEEEGRFSYDPKLSFEGHKFQRMRGTTWEPYPKARDFERFLGVLKGVNPEDQYVIHGSAYGTCCANLLYTMIGLRDFGRFPFSAEEVGRMTKDPLASVVFRESLKEIITTSLPRTMLSELGIVHDTLPVVSLLKNRPDSEEDYLTALRDGHGLNTTIYPDAEGQLPLLF